MQKLALSILFILIKNKIKKSLTQHRGCQRHDAVVGPAFGPHPLGMQPIPIEKVVQIG